MTNDTTEDRGQHLSHSTRYALEVIMLNTRGMVDETSPGEPCHVNVTLHQLAYAVLRTRKILQVILDEDGKGNAEDTHERDHMNATETISWNERFKRWWESARTRLDPEQQDGLVQLVEKSAKLGWNARGLAEAKIAAAEAQFDTAHAFNAATPKMVADMNRIPYGTHHVTLPSDDPCPTCGALGNGGFCAACVGRGL